MDLDQIFLTFDDGLAYSCILAARYLAAQHIRATFFIVPGWIDRTCVFTDRSNPHGAHLTWEDTEHLLRLGHSIGNHTFCHANLAEASEEQVTEEIGLAKDAIQSRLSIECPAFASPFNRCNEMIVTIAAKYHELVRIGPHMKPSISQLEQRFPVYPSISFGHDFLAAIDAKGLPHIETIVRKRAAIVQFHGFDGEGWSTVPFKVFQGFVEKYKDYFSEDDLVGWYSSRSL